MKRSNLVAALVILVIIVAAAVWGLTTSNNNKTNNQPNNNPYSSQTSNSSNSTSTTNGQTSSVSIENMMFTPAQITVSKGTTVTWTNNDSVAHTVTDDNAKGPDSGSITPGQTYSYTYNTTGSFPYHCNFHSQMHGTVVVR